MTRTSRIAASVGLVAVIVVVLLLVPTRTLDDQPSPADAAPAAIADDARARLQQDLDGAAPTTAPRAAAPSAETLRVRVTAFDGSPSAGSTVVVTREDRLLAHAETDGEGRASLAATPDPVDVLVLDAAHVPLLATKLERGAGEHDLALPERVTLRGRVLVDGAVPARAVKLTFYGSAKDAPPRFAPEFVRAALAWPKDPRGPWIDVRTDGAGRFEVAGLHPAWRGRVKAEPTYLPEGGRLSTPVEDLRSELVIRLKGYAVVTGRVVRASDRSPVAKATGNYERSCPLDGDFGDVESDEEGVFVIRLTCEPVTRLRFSIGAQDVGRVARDLENVPREGLDLGDLVLEPASDVHVLVLDADEKPLAAAVAFTNDGSDLQSEPTQADGRCVLRTLLRTTTDVGVACFGYRTVVAPLGGVATTAEAPLRVVLTRLPVLEVRAHEKDGGVLPRLVVHVHCWDKEPLSTPTGRTSTLHDVESRGTSGSSMTTRDDPTGVEASFQFRARLDDTGILLLAGFEPRDRTLVRIEDPFGFVLGERELPPSAFADGEVVDFEVDRPSRALALEVVGPKGEPVRHARVSSTEPLREIGSTREDGRLTVAPIYADRVDVRVSVRGYVATEVNGIAMDAPTVSRRVVLDTGATVRVRVVDPQGRVLRPDRLGASANGQRTGTVTRCPDEPCFLVADLGSEPVELEAHVGGRAFKKLHDPRASNAQIDVPDHGGLRVEFDPPLVPPAIYSLYLVEESNPELRLWQQVVPEARMEFIEVPVVFPGSYKVTLSPIDPDDGGTKEVAALASGVAVRANDWSTARLAKP